LREEGEWEEGGWRKVMEGRGGKRRGVGAYGAVRLAREVLLYRNGSR